MHLGDNDEDDDERESEEWMRAIDRGGLIFVSDKLYMMFQTMELELRKHLKLENDVNIKDNVMKELMNNDDVLFYWSLVSVKC